MWTQVGVDDLPGLDRHVAIMHQMDHGYGNLTARELGQAINEQRGEVWHYQGQGFEIAMLFQYSWPRMHWQLAQVGFVGNVQPAEVLERNVARAKGFFQAHNDAPSFFCAPPHSMDYPPLLVYYGLCLQHPQLQITVVHQAETKDIWEVRYVGP